MKVFITVNSDKTLRITDGEGAFLTVYTSKKTAQILSVSVPEEGNRRAIGKELLLASEKILSLKGIEKIYADFSDGIEGAKELFQSAGYQEESAADILSLPMGILIYSPNVKSSLQRDSRYTNYATLTDLSITQMEDAFKLISDIGLSVSCYDAAHYNREISTVVFDKKQKPVSVILCTDSGRDLHVNFLASRAGIDPTFNLMAMLGMVEALVREGGEDRYDNLTMAVYNEGVVDLLERILVDENGMKTIGRALTMSKSIKDGYADASGYEYQKARDDYQEFNWKREIRNIPYQKNIILKSRWSRGKDS